MAIPFTCPKCNQKLTLTSSKPGDWLDCPTCGATVQVPGAAPPVKPKLTPAAVRPTPARTTARPTPPPRPTGPAVEPLDRFDDELRNPWSDKRVWVGVLAGGIGLLLIGLLAVVLAVQKSKKEPEVVRNDPPPAARPAPSSPANVPGPPARPNDDPPSLKGDPAPEPNPDPPAPVKPPPNTNRLDPFGNPLDQNAALAQQDEFKGHRLLFWSPHTGAGDMFFRLKNPLWKALADKGFVVRREFGRFKAEWLKEIDQLWILSTATEERLAEQRRQVPNIDEHRRNLLQVIKNLAPAQREEARKQVGAKFPKATLEDLIELDIADTALSISPAFHLTERDYEAIVGFVKAGKGLCLLADNDPFTAEANELSRRLFDVGVEGNYQGEKIAYVRNGRLTPELIEKYRGEYEVPDHPLLTGVNFVYEGITISNVSASDKLEVALRASDGKPVVAVSKVPGLRVIIDCGFTRYCHGPNDDVSFILMTAGTTRLAQNMAAHLAGKGAPKRP